MGRIPLLNSQLPFAGIPSPGGAVTPGHYKWPKRSIHTLQVGASRKLWWETSGGSNIHLLSGLGLTFFLQAGRPVLEQRSWEGVWNPQMPTLRTCLQGSNTLSQGIWRSRIDVTKQKLSTVSQTYLSFAKVVSGIICNASSIHPKFSNMYEGSDGNVEVFYPLM